MIVTLIIGLVAIIVAVVIYILQKENKVISYMVVSNSGVVPSKLQRHLDVTYRGKAVKDASVILVRLLATGNKPISTDDFETPITLTFTGSTEVISALTTQTRPADVNPELVIKGHEVSITPLLLNRHDLIELQLLLSGHATDVKLSGRISGGSFRQLGESARGVNGSLFPLKVLFDKTFLLLLLPFVIGFVALMIVVWNPLIVDRTVKSIIVAFFFLYVLALEPIVKRVVARRRSLWLP